MKYNHIDFFSSPNSKFIGFSDIRHPQPDLNPHTQTPFEHPQEQDKKPYPKLSFNSIPVEPILPFAIDFFDQKLQECQEEPQEYSAQKYPQSNQDQSMMIDIKFSNSYHAQTLYHAQNTYPAQNSYHGQNSLFTAHNSYPSSHNSYPAHNTYQMPKSPQNQNSMSFHSENMSFSLHPHQNHLKLQNSIYTTPRRKPQFFSAKKSCDSTASKTLSRNNQKGLRKLSSLAYSIVSQSTTTTYKQVAQKLLTHLNFNSPDIDDQDGPDRSSMQNVKRRVYDSLNVLLALGVIKRVGSKIAKQKQRKPFTTEVSPDLERYNQMLAEYNQRLKALETRRRTEKELKEKLQVFKRTVERNRKTKLISKTKIIKLPFLVFVSEEQANIDWVRKEIPEAVEKKKGGKRGQKQVQKVNHQDESEIKLKFKGFPQSYGDLDIFRLLEEDLNPKMKENEGLGKRQEMEEDCSSNGFEKVKKEEMSLIDEVLGGN